MNQFQSGNFLVEPVYSILRTSSQRFLSHFCCREALSAFERDYSQEEKQSMNLKIHAQKAELMLDYARANLFLADC